MNETTKDILYSLTVYLIGMGVGFSLSAGKKEEADYQSRVSAQASVIGRCMGWWHNQDEDTAMNIYRCEGLASRLDVKGLDIPPDLLEARSKALWQCVGNISEEIEWQTKVDKCEQVAKGISE